MRSSRSRRRLPSQHSLQALGAAVARPLARAGAAQAALGRDHEVVRVRVQRLGDQVLADLGPVGVGGVDQVDAELDRRGAAPRLRLVGVVGRAPDAVAGDPHRAEAEPADLEVAADREGRGHASEITHAAGT